MKNKNVKMNENTVFKLNLTNLLTIILANILCVYVLWNIMGYSKVSQSIFTLISIAVLVLILCINLLNAYSFIDVKGKLKYCAIVVNVLIICIFGYVSWASVKINDVTNKVILSGDTLEESKSVAFVTYKNTIILDKDDIDGATFGIIGNSEFQEGNVLAKEELEANDITVDFVEYETYMGLYLGLVNGEIEVAALPTNYVELLSANEGYEEYLSEGTIIYQFDKVVEVKNEYNTDIDVTSEPFSMLIMGNDGGRTDTLILMTVNPVNMDITLTSIPRDSYVPIACYAGNSRDKITHARQVSRQCTVDTVEDLFDIDVNFFLETDFQGVVEIVDAMGGILITSPVEFVGQTSDDERGTYTVWVDEGTNMLDGEQVLAFARERYAMPGGDFQRQENQQQVIKSMITTAFSIRDINKLIGVLEAAGDHVKTNMTVDQMTSLINYGIKVIDSTHSADRTLRIINSRITGYGSMAYNEAERLPLWIMIPWKGAITDAIELIQGNLLPSSEKSLVIPSVFEFSITNYYVDDTIIQEIYDEPYEVIPMPDFMPVMEYNMTYEEAKAWASERGINLIVDYVEYGDVSYDESLANGTIIKQSVKFGTLTSDFNLLTISVIRNVSSDELIPNLIGEKLTVAQQWASANGYSITYNWISSNDVGYDASKAGLIATQSIPENEMKEDYTEISVSIYDYPSVINEFKQGMTKAQVETWAKKYLLSTTVTFKYQYDSTKTANTYVSHSVTNPTGNTSDTKTIKTNSNVTVTIYTNDANYASKFTIVFVDKDGAIIKEYKDVVEGSKLDAPEAPVINGYTFKGWDNTGYTNVTSDITIKPIYEKNTPTCGAGETLVDGVCQPNAPTCGDKETLVDGVCKPNTPTCGDGETLVDGVCKPNNPTCGDGETLVDGVCKPNIPTCGDGETLVDGVCQPNVTE